MQVTLTRTLILPEAVTTINELETAIQTWGQAVMRDMFAVAWQQLTQEANACPACGAMHSRGHGARSYRLRTLMGTVELPRQRRRCAACGRVFSSGWALLETVGAGRATPGLVEAASLAGASWPFASAADVLTRLSGAEVSPEWIRQTTAATGGALAAAEVEAAQAVVRSQVERGPASAPEQVLIGMDGGWVSSRDNPHGMEGKVGVVASGRERVGRQRRRLRGRRYTASFGSGEQFGPLLYREAAALGVEQAAQVVVLGDGAGWIASICDWCFPAAERRLDVWHLLRRARQAVGETAHQSTPADAPDWAALEHELCDALWHGQVATALTLVREQLPGAPGRALATYLRTQQAWIVDADALQADGEVVGSGMVEQAVDLVINRRLKGRRGMRWWRANAEAIVALRTRQLNQDYEAA